MHTANQASDTHRLYVADSVQTAWRQCLLPWIEGVQQTLWQHSKPVALVVPSHAAGQCVKGLLLEAGMPLIGVEIWTPGNLRDALRKHYLPDCQLALGEDLHLLARTAAKAFPDDPVAETVKRDPADYLKARDTLYAANYTEQALANPSFQRIGKRLDDLLETAGLLTTQQLDKALLEAAQNASEPCLQAICLHPAIGAAWASAFLLEAGGAASASASVVLQQAGGESPAAQLWQTRWEDLLGEPEDFFDDSDETMPLDSLVQTMNYGSRCHEELPIRLLAGKTPSDEAERVVAHSLAILAEEPAAEVAIILGRSPVHAREVSLLLERLEIPYSDGWGHYAMPTPVQQRLHAWVAWQQSRRLADFAAFIKLLANHKEIKQAEARSITRSLQAAWEATGAEDLSILEGWLVQDAQEHRHAILFMERWTLLPQQALLSDFLFMTGPALAAVGWAESIDERLGKQMEALSRALDEPLTVGLFLDWLGALLRSPGRARSQLGREGFARVHLLRWSDALSRPWQHVVLMGLNADVWPCREQEQAPLPEFTIQQLNAPYLEGMTGQSTDRRFYIPQAEDQVIAMRETFQFILEGVACTVALSATLGDIENGNADLPLSELLQQVCFALFGKTIKRSYFTKLLSNETPLRALLEPPLDAEHTKQQLNAIKHANQQRQDASEPFSEYSFSIGRPLAEPLPLSCKDLQSALKWPVQVWSRKVLGLVIETDFNEASPWMKSRGIWVHDWLAISGSEGIQELPEADAWRQRIINQASSVRRRVEASYRASKRGLPDWWLPNWRTAREQSMELASQVASLVSEYSHGCSEVSLPDGLEVPTQNGALRLTGRIDLILSESAEIFAGRFLVIDFKTGNDKAVSLDQVAKGGAVQLALYSLALKQQGSPSTAMAILKPGDMDVVPLNVEQLAEVAEVFDGLANIQRSGMFGQLTALTDDNATHDRYPVASCAIDTAILKAKWGRTHPWHKL